MVLGALFTAAILAAVAAAHSPHAFKRHHGQLVVERNNITAREPSVYRRFDQSKFSWYVAGLGACGGTNSASDFIVALNTPQWDGGSHCFEMITITYGGKSTQAQIVDRCEECPYGGLDFSHDLFAYFTGSPEQVGIIYGAWNFGGATTPTPSTTALPSRTSQQPTSPQTTTSHQASSSQSASSTLSPPSTSTTSTGFSASSSSSTPTVAQATNVLSQLNLVLLQFGGILVAAAEGGSS